MRQSLSEIYSDTASLQSTLVPPNILTMVSPATADGAAFTLACVST